MTARRRRRFAGIAFDAIAIGVALVVGEQVVQDWLFENPRALFHGLVALHLIACPALLVALVMGYGKAEQEIYKTGSGVLGWAMAFVWCGSFVVPGVLSLIYGVAMWEMMLAIFGPLVGFALWMGALIFAEHRQWIAPARVGVPKARWRVQALAILTWAYLVWLETMLISAAATPGPLSRVGVPLGVVIDYLPIRVALYYVCEGSRFERVTIAISVALVLVQIASA